MDLDGDGKQDIISGCYEGEFTFFKRNPDGTFAAGQILKDKTGKVINVGAASTIFAVDYDGDGDLDLLCGQISGQAFFIPNEGKGKELLFGAPVELQANGKPIRADGNDSHILAVDWNGDGKLDLLLGEGNGGVKFFPNVASNPKGLPQLGPPVQLVAAPDATKDTKDANAVPRGTYAKLAVVDWNGDGKLDLVIGDHQMTGGMKPDLTDAEKKLYAELDQKQKAAQSGQNALYGKYWSEALKAAGKTPQDKLTAAEKAKIQADAQAKANLDAEYKAKQKEVSGFSTEKQKYMIPYQRHGYVWVFLTPKK